jgi:cellulose synthase/poly-beta-1,6-N-acetylglucosamine synthase-like glycosyltransferase/transcriptional regulator with XRE-family HTH domain
VLTIALIIVGMMLVMVVAGVGRLYLGLSLLDSSASLPLHRRVRELRMQQGLLYTDLSLQVGLPARLIAEFELGLHSLSADQLRLVAAALGTDPHALAAGVAAPNDLIARLRARSLFTKSRLSKAVTVLAIVILNVVLIYQGLPLRLEYLTPQLALPVGVIIITLAFWLRQRDVQTKAAQIRVIGAIIFFLCECYAVQSLYLAWTYPAFTAIIHALAVVWNTFAVSLGVFNQFLPRDRRVARRLPAVLPEVAAVIPTYGEPIEVLEPVLRTLVDLDYPAEKLRVYISDDGRRPEIEQLAARYNVIYNTGPQRDAKAGNLNSCLQLIHTMQPNCDLVLTQDADDVADASIVKKLIGYFTDPQVAFVQTPKDSIVPKGDPFSNRERIFYDTIQPGRNGANAAFACGSGVIWRISAVEHAGGFSTWNLVEDLTTSYELHSLGYRSHYHNETLSIGLAPDDIPGLLKQRGTWAADTLRLFFFQNPLFKPGKLTLRQRLQYLELGVFYLTCCFSYPLLFLVPIVSLVFGDFMLSDGSILILYVLFNIFNWLYYLVLAQGNLNYAWRCWQYGFCHVPTYQRAIWVALRSRRHKPRYIVTRKTRLGGFYGRLLWPQFTAIGSGIASICIGVVRFGHLYPAAVLINSVFVLYYLVMLSGICRAAFYGVAIEALPAIGPIARLIKPQLRPAPGAGD